MRTNDPMISEHTRLRADFEVRLRFETLISDLSSKFVNLPPDEVDREIKSAQRRVCECLELDLSALWQWSVDDPEVFIMTHLYRPLGGPPVPERMNAQDYFPWALQETKAGRVIMFGSLEEVPVEAAWDLETWRHYGIKNVLNIPLSAGGKPPFGSVSFHAMRAERDWPADVVKRLMLVAQIFSNALARKRADESLRESEECLKLATDSAEVGLWSLDLDTQRVWVNSRMRELFRFAPTEELTYETFLKLIHPEDREAVRQSVQQSSQTDKELTVEYRIALPDGEVRWIAARGRRHRDSSAKPCRLMGAANDITARKRTDAELQLQRMELAHVSRASTLGELAGSLAHELNQPLTAILSNAQAALRYMNRARVDLEEVRDILKDIVEEDIRASEVIRRMRGMLKKSAVQMQPLDLNETIHEVLSIVHSDLIARNVFVVTELTRHLPLVLGDRIQLQQVLLNLIINGCEAMHVLPDSERQLLIRTELDAGSKVRVSVGDRGAGIASEMMDRVFDPFYTTKPHGLGMGLPICRSIVTAHGGRLWAERNGDRGAAFHFTLTVHQEEKT